MEYKFFYYKQPQYFSKFKCTGGSCLENCCFGWNIFWTKEECEKIINSNCSEELKSLVNKSFEWASDNNTYRIKLEKIEENQSLDSTLSICPMLDKETGLCKIQKELGEEYLSEVCRTYPRRYRAKENVIFRWCHCSCNAVINLLIEDEHATELTVYQANNVRKFLDTNVDYDPDERIIEFPVLKYRFDLFGFYVKLFHCRERSIEDSIILGAIASKHFSESVEQGKYDDLPEIINNLNTQLNNKELVKSLSEIKPNYQLTFKLVTNMMVRLYGYESRNIDITSLHDGKKLIIEKYLEGMENFYKAFENREYVLKNIIINTFYDLNEPIGDRERSLFENYSYFVLCAAMLKTVAASVGYKGGDIINNFKLVISEISRGLFHNKQKTLLAIDDIKNEGLTTPAHLALIIK